MRRFWVLGLVVLAVVLGAFGQDDLRDVRINDDYTLRFGTDDDFRVGYDETTDNRLEITDGTNLFGHVTDDGTTATLGWLSDIKLLANDKYVKLGDTSQFWIGRRASDGLLVILDSAGNVLLTVTDAGTTGALTATGNITGNAFLAGASNSVRGQLIAYGNATTSGAILQVYNGGTSQGNIERWTMGAATDFQISGLGGAQNFGALLTISAATGNVTLAKDLIITGRDAGPADDTDLTGWNANELVVRGTLDATTGIEINNVALAASHLSDGANVAHINAVETLSANWVNTTHPWADNEVADTLTVDSSSTINGVSAANFLAPAYGSMQLASGAVTVASGSTWYTVTEFTQGVVDGSIVSLSTSVFTVGATGKYEISIAGKVLSATATDGVSIGLSVNDADPTAATILVSKPAAVVDYRFAATNIISLSATNTARLKIRNDTDANNVTVSECYVTIKRLGP